MDLKAVFLFAGWIFVVCKANSKDEGKKDVLLLKDYVLVPMEYADNMLGDQLERVQDVRKDSQAALSDLLHNQDQYTTKQTAQVIAKVLESGVQALLPTYSDIKTLIFPNTELRE